MFQSESDHLAPRRRFVAEAADSCDFTTGKIRFSNSQLVSETGSPLRI